MGIQKLILNIALNFFRCFLVFFKVNSRKISFVSLESDRLSGDFKLIAERLEKEQKYELHYELFKFEKTLKGYVQYFFECIRQLFVINTSGLVILDYNNYVVSNFKRKDVKVLQVWHASGAIKKFGNLVDRDYKIENYDYSIVNSTEFADVFSKAFGIKKENVYATGIPKTDVLFDKSEMNERKKMFLEQHPEAAGKKVVLYAPTFRGRLMTDFKDVYLDLKKVKEELGEEYVVLYRLHPLVQKELDANASGIICCNSDDLYTLMEVSDLLISDYSALIIDYSVYHRPMVFYVPDIDEYRQSPGLALEYEKEMPGVICKTEAAVVAAVKNADNSTYSVADFQKKYFPYTDGKSTERVVALVNQIMEMR